MEENNELPGPAHNRIIVTLEDDACAEFSADQAYLKCIASHCMAWQWDEARNAAHPDKDPVGCCGLARRI